MRSMELVSNYSQIKDSIVKVKANKEGFITNFFLSDEKCELLIRNKILYIVCFDKVFFLLHKDTCFYHLYYISPSLDSLDASLIQLIRNFNELVLVVDIIGNNESIEKTVSVFNSYDFLTYTKLNRMSRIVNFDSYIDDKRVTYATIEHGKEISLLLDKYFDRYCEQIPLIEEINKWIDKNRILVILDKDKIIGFVIFEINGVTSYLRYWFTHPDFRENKVGSALLRRFFFESRNTKRQLFWVIESNENAIIRYKHYGFLPEKMFDIVLKKNKK